MNVLRKQTEEALLQEKSAHQTVQEQLKQQQKNSKLCMSVWREKCRAQLMDN